MDSRPPPILLLSGGCPERLYTTSVGLPTSVKSTRDNTSSGEIPHPDNPDFWQADIKASCLSEAWVVQEAACVTTRCSQSLTGVVGETQLELSSRLWGSPLVNSTRQGTREKGSPTLSLRVPQSLHIALSLQKVLGIHVLSPIQATVDKVAGLSSSRKQTKTKPKLTRYLEPLSEI